MSPTAPPSTPDPAEPLRLQPIAGPPLPTLSLGSPGPAVVGRSSRADLRLPDQSVSRRHLSVRFDGSEWLATELGSKHGTLLGGVALEVDRPTPLRHGDVLSVGPWALRVHTEPGAPPTALETTNDAVADERVDTVPDAELAQLESRRLRLLIDCAAAIHGSSDEAQLAAATLDALLDGTGFTRGAVVRPSRSVDEVEVVAARRPDHETGPLAISRSLLRAAAAGRTARLTEQPAFREAVSVIELGIRAAICAPVVVGDDVVAFLYTDVREPGVDPAPEAAAYCDALARMCGLAMANLHRRELADRQERLERDLRAARIAQRRIMPRDAGRIGPVRYALRAIPGRVVAGDLFDLVELPGGRAAALLGDVTGKGVGAGIVMASAQAHLHGSLTRGDDPEHALALVNTYTAARSAPHEFITMWLALFDPDDGTITSVDAGQGLAVVVGPNGPPRRLDADGGFPLGIEHDAAYAATTAPLAPDERLVLASDGAVEQPGNDGELFGIDRLLTALDGSTSADDDVERILAAVRAFAGRDDFADDLTVASIGFHPR